MKRPNHDETNSINELGDVVIETSGVHGGDISSQRFDDLDKKALNYALNQNNSITAVDIGCGFAAQGLRFSLIGADVTLIDAMDITDRVSIINDLFDMIQMEFINKDVRNLTGEDLPVKIDVVYSQRFIHYLTFSEAKDLLKLLNKNIAPSGRIFLSASGLHTELGEDYPDRDKLPKNRYSSLKPSVAKKHGIHDQVCLYEKQDMRELFEYADFEPIEVFCSGFGNIKGVAKKK